MLVCSSNGVNLTFWNKPEVLIPSIVLIDTLDILLPRISIVVKVEQYLPDYLQSYSGIAKTYRRGESWVHVTELAPGDTIRCWLKSRHYLERLPIKAAGEFLVHKYVGKNRSSNSRSGVTEVRGTLKTNNVGGQEFHISVGPGGLGWPYEYSATAIIPWLAISRIEVVRRRFDSEGRENVRFPKILPVRFR